ncbi:nicotinamide N-methyltransferase [Colletotrichum karsti]|uniref:Nicotinamide N-methyltransferase n=1 Tax=Colletotrichum karsti TaxID=1095194 RepID=A0A9P6I2N8_9PEZI|nr:nicotinamide N-methyltransferase [Colletotrichum karsti]KAF9870820.1 nicotinamide N-methyltransferase [Colletotrichum karsti]
MALTSRVSLIGPPTESPEDFFVGSIGVMFPDDVTNQHGDADDGIEYASPHLRKPLRFDLAEPSADEDRKLFSHYLWNSSLQLGEFVEAGTLGLDSVKSDLGPVVSHFDVRGLTTLELGAGTAIPSIMSALLGAVRTAVTDYPAPAVLKTLRTNIDRNIHPSVSPTGELTAKEVLVEGHSWGELEDPFSVANKHAFDRVFIADCLWMPWQHANLHKSAAWFLRNSPEARCWVVAGFHTGRPKMRGFFDEAALAEAGLEIESIWERDCDGVEREWVWDRGIEDASIRKRWLVCGVLKRKAKVDAA